MRETRLDGASDAGPTMAETLRDWIEMRLRAELAPTQLDVIDE